MLNKCSPNIACNFNNLIVDVINFVINYITPNNLSNQMIKKHDKAKANGISALGKLI